MSFSPPPPGSETPPPPSEEFSHIPPPDGEKHVDDVLERKRKFSWKNFGGDGFLASVVFHVLLAIIALFYVVSQYRAPTKNTEPEVFATGAGGGNKGDKPKTFEQKLRTRQVNVKMPARITSKGASAIALPDTPPTATTSFASGLTSGGLSKGLGGGSGGGEGTGLGIGKGGGRNFVSLFGVRGRNDRLTGYIYDFVQTSQGRPSPYAKRTAERGDNLHWMNPLVIDYMHHGWSESRLSKYYRAPEQLGVSRILIPKSDAADAPAAFGAEGKMKGGSWIAVYHGKVRAPFTGRIRFIGNADNYLSVRWEGKNVLAYECNEFSSPTRAEPGCRTRIAEGKWIDVEKGRWYEMSVLIGDAGGAFHAFLGYEGKAGDKLIRLFLTAPIYEEELREILAKDRGELPKRLDPDSPVWACKSASSSVR